MLPLRLLGSRTELSLHDIIALSNPGFTPRKCPQTSNPIRRLAPVTKAMRDGFVVIRRRSSRQNGCFTVAALSKCIARLLKRVLPSPLPRHRRRLSGGFGLTQGRRLRRILSGCAHHLTPAAAPARSSGLGSWSCWSRPGLFATACS